MKNFWIYPQDDQSKEKLDSGLKYFGYRNVPDLLKIIDLRGKEEELPLSLIPSSLMLRIENSICDGTHWNIRVFSRTGDDGLIREELIARHHTATIQKTKKAIKKAQKKKA
jgi:hypothetical protein